MPDLVAAVTAAADDPETFVDAVRPPHQEYAALAKALDDLHGQKEKGGWVKVPLGEGRSRNCGSAFRRAVISRDRRRSRRAAR